MVANIYVRKDYQEYQKGIIPSSVLESSRNFFAVLFLDWCEFSHKKFSTIWTAVPENAKMNKAQCGPQWIPKLFIGCHVYSRAGAPCVKAQGPGPCWEPVGLSGGLGCGTHVVVKKGWVWIPVCFEWPGAWIWFCRNWEGNGIFLRRQSSSRDFFEIFCYKHCHSRLKF